MQKVSTLRNDPGVRPRIPTGVARAVRQRCGFGCVICGMPLYEYEHMYEWATVKRHVASEMTLLCNQHHREKTNGLLSKEYMFWANANPINKQGQSKPYLFHAQPANIGVQIGSNLIEYNGQDAKATMIAISIAQVPILWFKFEHGVMLMSLSLYDSSDKLVLSIRENELVYSSEPWDITLEGKTLTVRAAARDTMLALTFAPNERKISIDRAKLRYGGYEIDVSSKGLAAAHTLQNCVIRGEGHLFNYGLPRVETALNLHA